MLLDFQVRFSINSVNGCSEITSLFCIRSWKGVNALRNSDHSNHIRSKSWPHSRQNWTCVNASGCWNHICKLILPKMLKINVWERVIGHMSCYFSQIWRRYCDTHYLRWAAERLSSSAPQSIANQSERKSQSV